MTIDVKYEDLEQSILVHNKYNTFVEAFNWLTGEFETVSLADAELTASGEYNVKGVN